MVQLDKTYRALSSIPGVRGAIGFNLDLTLGEQSVHCIAQDGHAETLDATVVRASRSEYEKLSA
jgi:hypothetical protein